MIVLPILRALLAACHFFLLRAIRSKKKLAVVRRNFKNQRAYSPYGKMLYSSLSLPMVVLHTCPALQSFCAKRCEESASNSSFSWLCI